ncbi:MAG: hypothetical protein ACLUDU_08370 [Butyricimonas faecihominis]
MEWRNGEAFEDMDKMGYFHGCFVVVTIRVEKLPEETFEWWPIAVANV